MALTAAQIIDLSCQIAKVPGFTAQALAFLNATLQELAQDYDFEVIRKTYTFNFTTTGAGNGYAAGSGPNAMPADFLRLHRTGAFYFIVQVPYKLIGVKQEEFDTFVQQPGLQSYPYLAYVDVTQVAGQQPGLYVWPPASGAYPATIRYNPQMPDITDTSQVPWFPNSNYLYTRVAGELMKIANDDRWEAYLSDNEEMHPGGAGVLLRKYMMMKDDPVTAPKTVELDRRLFKPNIANVRNTKQIGWAVAAAIGLSSLLYLSLGGQPASAQSTKAQLNSEVTTNYPDNTTGAITPAILRTTTNDQIASWQQAATVNPQTGTSYTFLVSDYGKLVTFSNGSAVSVTLPQATTTFSVFNVYARNLGAGTVTITPTTSTINGGATITLATNQAAWIVSDGANYQTWINGSVPVACGGMPALTGDVTTSAGSCATTLATAQPSAHTWALGQTFSSAMTYGGVTLSNSVTGTGSMVLSAAPTITGHPTIEGVTSTGATGTGNFVFGTSPSISGLTVTGSFTATGLVTLADHATQAANTVLANGTSGAASPTAFAMPSCSTSSTALQWLTNTGFQCGTITASASSITIGTTTISSGTDTRILYQNGASPAGTIGEYTITGSGTVVAMQTSPSFTTPTLGVAAATTINKVTLTAPATGSTLTIADGKTLTASNSITLAGTDSTTWTGASSNMTLAALNLTSQALTGGVVVTAYDYGTVSSGTTTVVCGNAPLQKLTNNGAFTLATPASDSSCIIEVTNGASAGAITFSGWTVGSNTGDSYATTNTNKYDLFVRRINGHSSYQWSALQ